MSRMRRAAAPAASTPLCALSPRPPRHGRLGLCGAVAVTHVCGLCRGVTCAGCGDSFHTVAGLTPPGEHDGVDAGVCELAHLRQQRRVVGRRVQPSSGIVRRVRMVRRRVRDARREPLIHLGRPMRHGPVVPMEPLAIDGWRPVPEVEGGVHEGAGVGVRHLADMPHANRTLETSFASRTRCLLQFKEISPISFTICELNLQPRATANERGRRAGRLRAATYRLPFWSRAAA